MLTLAITEGTCRWSPRTRRGAPHHACWLLIALPGARCRRAPARRRRAPTGSARSSRRACPGRPSSSASLIFIAMLGRDNEDRAST